MEKKEKEMTENDRIIEILPRSLEEQSFEEDIIPESRDSELDFFADDESDGEEDWEDDEEDYFDYSFQNNWDDYDDYNDYEEEEHYSEFAGTYAQEELGYSDEDIWTIFEGDPDACWNVC